MRLHRLMACAGIILALGGTVSAQSSRTDAEYARWQKSLKNGSWETMRNLLPLISSAEASRRASLYIAALENPSKGAQAEALGRLRWDLSQPEGNVLRQPEAAIPLVRSIANLIESKKLLEIEQGMAELIACFGPSAFDALPSLASALKNRAPHWDSLLARALVTVSGGRSDAPNRLRRQLRSPDAQKRLAAASALGFLMQAASNRVIQFAPGRYSPTDDDVAFLQDSLRSVPSLAAALSDKKPAVRVAAGDALQRWADWMRELSGTLSRLSPIYANTLWDAALLPMSRALQTSDVPVRRAVATGFSSLATFSESARAARAVPVALFPHLPALRAALHDSDKSVRSSVHETFHSLTRANNTLIAALLLADLQSEDPARRRDTVFETAQIADVLWRALTIPSFQEKTAEGQEKTRLRRQLSEALTATLDMKDLETRRSAAEAALAIGEWTASAQWHGSLQNDTVWVDPMLDKARDVMAQDDRALAARLTAIQRALFPVSLSPR